MAVDERLIGALHVETLRHEDRRSEAGDHQLFQTSSFYALLDGRYDGDVSFAELSGRGDLGLGTGRLRAGLPNRGGRHPDRLRERYRARAPGRRRAGEGREGPSEDDLRRIEGMR
jgi:hypothetical protein